jgi:predicted aconitase with swiveling domain
VGVKGKRGKTTGSAVLLENAEKGIGLMAMVVKIRSSGRCVVGSARRFK